MSNLITHMIAFGAYSLFYLGTSNDMNFRAVLAIVLRVSNSAGEHNFIILPTGERIHGYKWDELTINKYVISL